MRNCPADAGAGLLRRTERRRLGQAAEAARVPPGTAWQARWHRRRLAVCRQCRRMCLHPALGVQLVGAILQHDDGARQLAQLIGIIGIRHRFIMAAGRQVQLRQMVQQALLGYADQPRDQPDHQHAQADATQQKDYRHAGAVFRQSLRAACLFLGAVLLEIGDGFQRLGGRKRRGIEIRLRNECPHFRHIALLEQSQGSIGPLLIGGVA